MKSTTINGLDLILKNEANYILVSILVLCTKNVIISS